MINTVKYLYRYCFQPRIFRKLSFNMGMLKFPLPDLGQKIKQGTVKKLYVKEGEKVQQFQKIADVQSDKQFTEITAPQNGKISKIHYKQSEVCKVGDLFMQIETSNTDDNTDMIQQSPIKNQKKQQPKGQQKLYKIHSNHDVNWSQSILASPVVRIFAFLSNVDIMKVKGSGKKGRILKQDIINYSQTSKQSIKQNIVPFFKNKHTIPPNKKVLMNPYQKGMQKSMTASNQVPHLYYYESIDMTQSERMRQQMKQNSMKVTLMGIFVKTLSMALKDFPEMNSHYDPLKSSEYKINSSHNVSLAIDSPNGLVAPNIKNVQNLSILQIQSQLEKLKKLADQSHLTRDHLQNGTICLSNIGTIGGVSACPLIICPQVCIIAIGKTVQKPYYILSSSTVLKKKEIVLGFGCDHRVLDGATVAKFANSWKKMLEHPYISLAKMR